MAGLRVCGERLDGANVGRPIAQEPADGRAERQARALELALGRLIVRSPLTLGVRRVGRQAG